MGPKKHVHKLIANKVPGRVNQELAESALQSLLLKLTKKRDRTKQITSAERRIYMNAFFGFVREHGRHPNLRELKAEFSKKVKVL